MSISSIEGGQGQRPLQNPAVSAQRPDIAQLLLNDSRQVQLRQLSPDQLARLRDYQNGILGNIQEVQSGFGIVFPPLGGPAIPPPIPGPPPTPPNTDPLEILRTQDPEAYAAFSRLKPEEQQAFLQLCRDVGLEMPPRGGMFGGILGNMGRSALQNMPTGDKNQSLLRGMSGPLPPPVPCQPVQPRINNDLLTILKSGKLTTKDSQGRSLLQNLTDLSTQEMGPTLDRKRIFGELCSQLADPGRITQGTHGTCAPTTIQHLQATKDPAEYARIMVGLTSRDGSVTLRNGDELKRDRGSLAQDQNFGRNTISRLYQSALMEYGDGEDEYDNRTDLHTAADDSTYSGQSNEGSERILEALFGEEFDSQAMDRGSESGRQRTEDLLREALNQGRQVPVSLEWSQDSNGRPGYHMLLVVGMTEDSVILRNPWGGHDNNESDPSRGPDREALDNGGTIAMSKDEFLRRCCNIITAGENNGRKSR